MVWGHCHDDLFYCGYTASCGPKLLRSMQMSRASFICKSRKRLRCQIIYWSQSHCKITFTWWHLISNYQSAFVLTSWFHEILLPFWYILDIKKLYEQRQCGIMTIWISIRIHERRATHWCNSEWPRKRQRSSWPFSDPKILKCWATLLLPSYYYVYRHYIKNMYHILHLCFTACLKWVLSRSWLAPENDGVQLLYKQTLLYCVPPRSVQYYRTPSFLGTPIKVYGYSRTSY